MVLVVHTSFTPVPFYIAIKPNVYSVFNLTFFYICVTLHSYNTLFAISYKDCKITLYWQAVLDLNQGTQMRLDLQSSGFSHSPNYPCIKLLILAGTERFELSPTVLETVMLPLTPSSCIIYEYIKLYLLNIFTFKLQVVGFEPTQSHAIFYP